MHAFEHRDEPIDYTDLVNPLANGSQFEIFQEDGGFGFYFPDLLGDTLEHEIASRVADRMLNEKPHTPEEVWHIVGTTINIFRARHRLN